MNARALFAPVALLASSLLAPSAANAEEGMWLLNRFPKEKTKAAYGFAPDDAWLERTQLASARIAGGCSASFVSERGLVMTNHHCAHSCIAQLSTAEKDFQKLGFYAKTEADEVKCPEIEINQLAKITDVTERLNKATKGLPDAKFNEALKAESARIEKECSTGDRVRCEVVTLYNGGAYHLYEYRRFQDVRLVFSPELAIAFFGGDPDNFMFPRFDLDMAFLRIYEGDQPAKLAHWFRWSSGGARDGELTFVIGNPGRTDRQLTVAELEFQRDTALPERLIRFSELRGLLTEFQRRGEEQKRVSTEDLFYVENSIKARRGMLLALQDKKFFTQKIKEEEALRTKIDSSPELKAKYGATFAAIAKAQADFKNIRQLHGLVENGGAFYSDLYRYARTLVRGAEERLKPNEKRFKELRESALPGVTQKLFSSAPISDELEIATLSWSLTKLREDLGPDDAVVKKVLGKESPDEVAERLVKGTKLKDVALRKQLWEGGKKAVDASKDPLILFAKMIDPDARAVRKKYEDEIESVWKRNSELLAKGRFEALGSDTYPDATFTPRISYGRVKGWEENGKPVKPFTTFGGAFDRATGRPPFDLPPSWLASKPKLNLTTPFNLVTTNDIIGGNSGSPMINQKGEVVGLVFDGNIHSLGGDYGFDENVNRAVAVHSEGMIHALEKIYGADRIVRELRPASLGKK